MKQLSRNKFGFTLIEMLIVITIISILASIVLPRYLTSTKIAKEAAHRAERQAINTQFEIFYFIYNRYPETMTKNDWGLGDADGNGISPDWKEFFPDGIPKICNQQTAWKIKDGRIQQLEHKGHESNP
jgi:prepilin-type N-terminal cleavage/methylation domain-containing protein